MLVSGPIFPAHKLLAELNEGTDSTEKVIASGHAAEKFYVHI
jgi:hypothetical protein